MIRRFEFIDLIQIFFYAFTLEPSPSAGARVQTTENRASLSMFFSRNKLAEETI